MMVRILRPLLVIVRAYDEVAARDSVEEVHHVIAAGSHHLFAPIDVLLTHRSGRRLVYQFSHCGIVYTGWGTMKDLHITRATHGAGNALGQLANAARQLLPLFCTEGPRGTPHLHGFGNDIKGSARSKSTNGENCWAKWRDLTAEERLQGGD